jgi:hypothetical protein
MILFFCLLAAMDGWFGWNPSFVLDADAAQYVVY